MILAKLMVILMLLAAGKSIAYDNLLKNPIRDSNDTFLQVNWILTHEFDPTEQQFVPLAQLDTLSFRKEKLYINGKQFGTYAIQQEKALLTFQFSKQKIPAFAHYPLAGGYHFRYAFDKSTNRLSLTPLEEQEVEGLISVEGRALLFAPTR